MYATIHDDDNAVRKYLCIYIYIYIYRDVYIYIYIYIYMLSPWVIWVIGWGLCHWEGGSLGVIGAFGVSLGWLGSLGNF
jgi:hypothetical protein